MTVFCAVENNRLERIVFMENTLKALSETMGVPYSCLKRGRSRKRAVHGYRIVKVNIDDDEEEGAMENERRG